VNPSRATPLHRALSSGALLIMLLMLAATGGAGGALASTKGAGGSGASASASASAVHGWRLAWKSNIRYLSALACPTVSECFVAGGTPRYGYILRTENDGQSWTATTIKAQQFFDAVACVDQEHCVIGGSGDQVMVTSDGGDHWSPVDLPTGVTGPSGLSSVTCAANGTCYAAAGLSGYSGTMLYVSTDSGQRWGFESFVHNQINFMTCPQPSSCVGVGSVPPADGSVAWPAASRTTENGWLTSSKGRFPGKWLSLTGVSCLSSSRCYATGLNETLKDPDNVVLLTNNLGQTWRAVATAPGLGGLTPWSISCPTSTACVAGTDGQSVVTTNDDGARWGREVISRFSGLEGATAVTCAAPQHCMALESGDLYMILVQG